MNSLRLLTLSLAAFIVQTLAAPPIPVADNFTNAQEDIPYFVPAPGVLDNDNYNGHPQLEALLDTAPSHGVLSLNGDGSFLYTSAADYNGPDSFKYRARRFVPPIPFTVDPLQSNVKVTIHVYYDQDGTEGPAEPVHVLKDASTKLDGTLSVGRLLPRQADDPFTEIQVTGASLRLLDRMDWDMGAPGVGDIHINSIGHTDPPHETLLAATLVMPRAAGDGASQNPNDYQFNSASGEFHQLNNSTGLNGDFEYNYFIVGKTPERVFGILQARDELFRSDFVNDIATLGQHSRIQSDGTTLTLTVRFLSTYTEDVEGSAGNTASYTYAVVESDGVVIGTAPAAANIAEESGPTTVSLTINPVNDAPVGVADTYFVPQGRPMTIPGTATGSSETLVAANSTWKYFYNNTNPGATWMDYNFNDSAWSSGPALLGYDTTPNAPATTIRANNTINYATAYFRKSFVVSNLSQTSGATLEIKRDDGAVVFVNGIEVHRDSNLPANNQTFSTRASSARPTGEEDVFLSVPINPTLLYEGPNVVAVEVHVQEIDNALTNPAADLRFDCRIVRTLGIQGVLANDTDIDSSPASFSASIRRQPDHGHVTLEANGGFTYVPTDNFTGPVSFDYAVSDGSAEGIGTATITIHPDDLDGDGMNDSWEREHNLNYTNGADATLDSDGDGVSNRLEFFALTDPNDSTDFLHSGAITLSGGNLSLSFHNLSSERRYQLESSGNLILWSDFGAPFSVPSGTSTVNVPFIPADASMFYRLAVDYTYP